MSREIDRILKNVQNSSGRIVVDNLNVINVEGENQNNVIHSVINVNGQPVSTYVCPDLNLVVEGIFQE